jgi:Esterase FrsA-like
MKLFFDDDELDGQLQRSVTHAYERGADVGEVLSVAARITPGDYESWYREWHAAAHATLAAATASRDGGHAASAAAAFLRASEYFRQAMFYLRADLDDPRLKDVYAQLRAAFREAARLLPVRIEAVRIRYETTTLNGYLMAADDSDLPRRTVLFPVGYDAPAEDSYLYAAPALRRGYTVLAFEGPGQGGVLYEQRLFRRPDFEHVLAPVVDFAITRPEVDAERLVLFGRSFAGYLAPRGATSEHRLAALVCDPGQVDLGAKVIERLPAHVVDLIRADDPAADQALAPMLDIPAIRRVWLPRMAAPRNLDAARLPSRGHVLHAHRARAPDHLPDAGHRDRRRLRRRAVTRALRPADLPQGLPPVHRRTGRPRAHGWARPATLERLRLRLARPDPAHLNRRRPDHPPGISELNVGDPSLLGCESGDPSPGLRR